MRRQIRLSFFLCLGICAFGPLFSKLSQAKEPSVYVPPTNIKVMRSDEGVQTKPFQGNEIRELKTGDTVAPWNEIITSADSFCDFIIGDKIESAVRMYPDSLVKIVSLDPVKLNLVRGSILSLIYPSEPPRKFTVQTPLLVATAKGTAFIQSMNTTGVLHGSVVVTGESDEIIVPEGQAYTVTTDGTFAPAPAPAPDILPPFQTEVSTYEQATPKASDTAVAHVGPALDDTPVIAQDSLLEHEPVA